MQKELLWDILNSITTGVRNSGPDHISFSCLLKNNHARDDKHNSASVSISTTKPSFVYCFSGACHFRGSFKEYIELAMETNPSLSDLLPLIDDYESRLIPAKYQEEKRQDFSEWVDKIEKIPFSKDAIDLLRSKGVTSIYKKFRVCYDPDQDVIVFPIFSFFRGKPICVCAQCRPVHPKPTTPKYTKYFGEKHFPYLFGQQFLWGWGDRSVAIVEGPFDAMHIVEEGFRAVSLNGVNLNSKRIELLKEAELSEVLWMLDPDAAGQGMKKEHLDLLSRNRIKARAPSIPKDPKYLNKDQLENIFNT